MNDNKDLIEFLLAEQEAAAASENEVKSPLIEKALQNGENIRKLFDRQNNLNEYMELAAELQAELDTLITEEQADHVNELFFKYVPLGKYAEALKQVIFIVNEKGIDELFKQLEAIQTKSSNDNDNSLDTAIKALNSIIPENAYMNNSKVINEMVKSNFPLDEAVSLAVEKRRSSKEITTFATLNYEADNITLTGKFTPYDREVHDAVCTLNIAGNTIFTAEMVYRAMNGLTNTEYVTPQAIGAVTRSIEKSRFTKLTIDFTQEAKARKLDINNAAYADMLLSVEEIYVSTGGATKRAYAFNKEPILYKYSNQIGQVISVPISRLKTTIRSSSDVVVLRGYLLRRIEGMKHKNGLYSNKILYEKIYENIEWTDPERYLKKPIAEDKDKANKIKKHVRALLEYWKTQEYIKDYKEYKEKNTIKGITIFY